MKVKFSLIVLLFGCLFLTSVLGCQPTPVADKPADVEEPGEVVEPVKIRVALEAPITYEIFADKFKELAEEKLGDKIEVTLYKGGSLGNQAETYQMVDIGQLEMAIGASAQAGLLRQYMAFDFPYIYSDRDHMEKVMKSDIPGEIHQMLLEEKNIRTLTIFDSGFRQVANKVRPIVTPDDFAGLAIRTPESPFRVKTFAVLGATPTPIPYGDLYMSLEQNIVDGLEIPVSAMYTDLMHEVTSYLSLTNHVYTASYIIADEGWWQTLPAEVQAALLEAAEEAADYTREVGREDEEKFTALLEEAGMQVNRIDIDSFRTRIQETLWVEYEDEMGELLRRIVALDK